VTEKSPLPEGRAGCVLWGIFGGVLLKKLGKYALILLAVCVMLFLGLYLDHDIGILKGKIVDDVRFSQEIPADWVTEGTASDTLAAYISYPEDRSDHAFSIYVNHPGLSFGYFFRVGGSLSEVQRSILAFTAEGYPERAFVSMNGQKVERIEIDNGNGLQVIDIDSGKPFAVVLPVNAGIVMFYDAENNAVEYGNHPL